MVERRRGQLLWHGRGVMAAEAPRTAQNLQNVTILAAGSTSNFMLDFDAYACLQFAQADAST